MSGRTCTTFVPQKFKPNSCQNCFLHRDVHATSGSPPEAGSPDLLRKKLMANADKKQLMHHRFEASRRRETLSKNTKLSGEVEKDIGYIRQKLGGSSLNATLDNSDYKSSTIKRLDMHEEQQQLQQREEAFKKEQLLREAESQRRHEEAQRRLREEQERRKKLEEELRDQETQRKKDYEAAVEARVQVGMPRNVAVGETTAERQRLSHETARGKWCKVMTHYGVEQERWIGCGCGQLKRDTWCSTYKAGIPPEDKESYDAYKTAEELFEKEVAKREAAGWCI